MTDQELNSLLDEWAIAEPPARLRARIFAPARRRLRWWIPAACAGVLTAAGFLQLAPHGLGSSTSPLAGGVELRTTTFLQPGLSPSAWRSRFATSGRFGPTHAQRYLVDRTAGTYTGYVARVTPAGQGTWSVAIEPVTAPPEGAAGRAVGLPVLPAPRVIHENEAFDLELSSNPHVFDRLEISSHGFADGVTPPAPRYLDAELHVVAPRVTVDGRAEAVGVEEARGLSLFLELAGDGRYVLAVEPDANARFVQAGTVDGGVAAFRLNGHTVRIESSAAIAGGPARPLYVLYGRGGVTETAFGSGGAAGQYR